MIQWFDNGVPLVDFRSTTKIDETLRLRFSLDMLNRLHAKVVLEMSFDDCRRPSPTMLGTWILEADGDISPLFLDDRDDQSRWACDAHGECGNRIQDTRVATTDSMSSQRIFHPNHSKWCRRRHDVRRHGDRLSTHTQSTTYHLPSRRRQKAASELGATSWTTGRPTPSHLHTWSSWCSSMLCIVPSSL